MEIKGPSCLKASIFTHLDPSSANLSNKSTKTEDLTFDVTLCDTLNKDSAHDFLTPQISSFESET